MAWELPGHLVLVAFLSFPWAGVREDGQGFHDIHSRLSSWGWRTGKQRRCLEGLSRSLCSRLLAIQGESLGWGGVGCKSKPLGALGQ